ncbi:MAG TPA: aminotransferase class V-fold PLP-dependent enzyme [Acidobacteriaceae bacterium]|nr:aminotransferase class V-fold PLP-dependent enzyme [Acidobacteriaceae bacterium]
MRNKYSRRSFFALGRSALASLGLAGFVAPLNVAAAVEPSIGDEVDYYDKLGVKKIINAAGTYTMYTASIMPPSVQAAVATAAKHPVRLNELQLASGAYIAKKLHCEAALVSAGAASGLTLGTAACITVANRNQGDHIPQHIPQALDGLKYEVIMQKGHRYSYDHALLNCGVRIVEVETIEQYSAAFNSNTVLAHYFNAATSGNIGHKDWIRIAHQHHVPCMNDAAADVPPISNLWNYTQMGYDLVTISGGKGIRGPQNAGLLLGKRELIDAAMLNNNSIDDVVGRAQKVAKEQIIGMVAAVDWILSQSEDQMTAEFHARAQRIADYLKSVPTLTSEIFVPPVCNHVPTLLLRYDQKKVKISPRQVLETLRNGSPNIELHPATGEKSPGLPSDENTILVGVWMLQPGEDMLVARHLRKVLMSAVS